VAGPSQKKRTALPQTSDPTPTAVSLSDMSDCKGLPMKGPKSSSQGKKTPRRHVSTSRMLPIESPASTVETGRGGDNKLDKDEGNDF
jgi:hypothetical protein